MVPPSAKVPGAKARGSPAAPEARVVAGRGCVPLPGGGDFLANLVKSSQTFASKSYLLIFQFQGFTDE